MNSLMKLGLGLLAATAAASSMAQSSTTSCNGILFDTAYSTCQIRYVQHDEASLLAAVPSTWGVTGSFYKDSLTILNEPSETVISLAAITPTSTQLKASYELTFQQAVAGPFALILGPASTDGTITSPLFYRFDNGVSAGDTLSIGMRKTSAINVTGLSYAAVVGVATPVPEPQTYALALAGLGVAGWAARRRRVSTAS